MRYVPNSFVGGQLFTAFFVNAIYHCDFMNQIIQIGVLFSFIEGPIYICCNFSILSEATETTVR